MTLQADLETPRSRLQAVVANIEKVIYGKPEAVRNCVVGLLAEGHVLLEDVPGTGKTTVARLLARYLHALGVLPLDRFVEKNGLELKGRFVGHTSHTVKEAVQDAMGGCLFVDEAYSLVDRGGDRFSGEAVRMLLTELENNRGQVRNHSTHPIL